MTRAAGATNANLFQHSAGIPHAEQILRSIENSHDTWLLVEMNGDRCAGRQVAKLRWYDRHERTAAK